MQRWVSSGRGRHRGADVRNTSRTARWVAGLGVLAAAAAAVLVVGPAQAATTYTLSVSKNAARTAPVNLNGATVSGNIFVFTAPATGIKSVSFYLDDTARAHPAFHTETSGPYDFNGGPPAAATAYNSAVLTNGKHTITQAVTITTNAVQVNTATFTVGGGVVSSSSSSASTSTSTSTSSSSASASSSTSTSTSTSSSSASATATATATPSGFYLALSTHPDRSAAAPLAGQTVAGPLYVFTAPGTGVKTVSFYLDDPSRTKAAFHTESTGPYDFNGGPATAATAYDSNLLADGGHTITQVVTPTTGAVQISTAAFQVLNHPVVTPPVLVVENPDVVPANDWFVFSRIGTNLNPSPTYAQHDRDIVRLRNTGATSLNVTGLAITGTYVIDPSVSLPQTIPAGGTLDVPIHFVAVALPVVQIGSLTVTSTDPGRHTFKVTLAGAWAAAAGGPNEPTLASIEATFGYKTALVFSGQTFGGNGTVAAVGDEVLSPFWKVADSTKPVTARELANTHGLFQPAMYYYPRSDSVDPCLATATLPGSCTLVLNPPLSESQTLLPRTLDTDGVTYIPGYAEFTPTEPFGLNFFNFEYSDNARNYKGGDTSHGCNTVCGHHIRFYPLKNNSGAVVPNSYLVCVEMFGANFDYQDVVVLMTNVTPDLP